MMTDAPAWAAPWTAFIPIPPTPMTMTTSPARTSAERTADPHPVETPQLVRQATPKGTSSGHGIADWCETVEHWLKVATPAPWPTGWPSKRMR